MHRSRTVCLLAALVASACVLGPGGDPVDESTTGAPIPDETTAPEPTTAPAPDDTTLADPTTTGADGGSESGTTGWPECSFAEISVDPVIPRIMLVLDKSGSMANHETRWDHDGDDADDDGLVDGQPNADATPKTTRWRSLYETVEAVLVEFDARMAFGAVLFPALEATKEYGPPACLVHAAPDVPVGGGQADEILAAMPAPSATALFGGTPAAAAITTGVAGLLADVEPDEPRYIVLVTDGAANCPVVPQDDLASSLFEIYDENLPLVVADALASGVPTFVVGVAIADEVSDSMADGQPDATNAFERLNAVAEAGGRARPGAEKFYNATDQSELHAAFLDIAASVTPCTLELDAALHLLNYVAEVVVGGRPPLVYGEQQVEDCASESGWRFTDRTVTQIELCGDACAQYKRFGELDIQLFCRRD